MTTGQIPPHRQPAPLQAAPTDRRTKPRGKCDTLGVCQASATPCAGCGNHTHPAYHHLHRVVLPTAAPACIANQRQQSHKPCPCPQACELPAPAAQHGLQDTPTARTGCALFAGVVLAVVVCFVVILAASA